MNLSPLEHPSQIESLHKSLWIEASAGTGKTYTIEHYIARLLIERDDLQLSDVLLVTYTEKATGEMKQRVRALLQEKQKELLLEDNAQAAQRLHQMCLKFEQATISTIHGFCKRMIDEENLEFQSELANETKLGEKALIKAQRELWPRFFGDKFGEILTLLVYNENTDVEFIRDLNAWSPELGMQLVPDPNDYDKNFKELEQGYLKIQRRLRDNSHFNSVEAGVEMYQQLNFHASSKRAVGDLMIRPLFEFFNQHEALNLTVLKNFLTLHDGIMKKDHNKVKYHRIVPDKWNKGGCNKPEVIPFLEELVAVFTEFSEKAKSVVGGIKAQMLSLLKEAVEEEKLNHELWIHGDLIKCLSENLVYKAGLLDRLRLKYKVAIVDEFQDTDSLQWQIFKSLFLGSADHQLCLVGDPKQAIYGFRNADLSTYFKAKTEMQKAHALGYTLQINYRSSPQLLSCFNALFDKNWFAFSRQMQPLPFEVPKDESKVSCWAKDCSQASLIGVDLSKAFAKKLNQRDGLAAMCDYIVNSITSLLRQPPLYINKGKKRLLEIGDIAIIGAKNYDLHQVQVRLENSGIAGRSFKRRGLFETREACYIGWLWEVMLDHKNERLVSKLKLTPLLSEAIQAQWLLSKWRKLADLKAWSTLARSILKQSALSEHLASGQLSLREYANYEHLLERAAQYGSERSMDLYTFSQAWLERRLQAQALGDENLMRCESEQAAVRLITLHSSKGLQFPVVYILPDVKPIEVTDVLKYEQDGCLKYNLLKKDASANELELSLNELKAGAERLHYVGCTRAIVQLHVPIVEDVKSEKYTSIIDLYTSAKNRLEGLSAWEIRAYDDEMGGALVASGQCYHSEFALDGVGFNSFYSHKIPLRSFTQIKHSHDHYQAYLSSDELSSFREDDELWSNVNVDKNDQLPYGAAWGDLLHQAIAIWPLDDDAGLSDEALIQLLRKNGLLSEDSPKQIEHVGALRKLVNATVNSPIAFGAVKMNLRTLKESLLREMPFKIPVVTRFGEEVLYEGISTQDGYWTGSLDAIVKIDKLWYIIDWKSNYLETNSETEMLKVVRQYEYDLQARIYAFAFQRWRESNPLVEGELGGAKVVFLRPWTESLGDHGIVSYSCDELKLDDLDRDMNQLLEQHSKDVQHA